MWSIMAPHKPFLLQITADSLVPTILIGLPVLLNERINMKNRIVKSQPRQGSLPQSDQLKTTNAGQTLRHIYHKLLRIALSKHMIQSSQ